MNRAGRLRYAAGGLLLALTAEASGRRLGIEALAAASPHVQYGLLCAGLALVVWGLAGGEARSERPWDWWAWAARHRGEIALVAGLALAALLLRLWHIGGAIRVLVDEIHFVSGVVSFWKPDEHIGLLSPMTNISPFTWIYPYWQAGLVEIFGRSLASLRAASAIVGALTIPALYLLARTLFDRQTALAAALLLASFPPHLHYSRIALLSIADPLVGTLALAFLARGLARGRRLDWALGGACLGLTAYFYEGGRLLFPPLAAAWAGWSWAGAPAGRRRALDGGLLVAGLAAASVAAPVAYVLLAGSSPLSGRMSASGLNADYWLGLLFAPASGLVAHLRDHLLPAVLVLFARPDATPYYGGETALVLPPLAPFFLLGAGWALGRWRHPGGRLLSLWIGLTALGNSLLIISAASTRYVVAFPALALAAAVGLRHGLGWLLPSQTAGTGFAPGAWLRRNAPALLAVAFGLWQLGYYFGPHLGAFDARFRAAQPGRDQDDAVFRALALPPGTQVHLVSRRSFDRGYAARLAAFLRDDLVVTGYVGDELTADILAALSPQVTHAFFVEPEDAGTLARLQSAFTLEGPSFSPYPVALDEQWALFVAPPAGELTR